MMKPLSCVGYCSSNLQLIQSKNDLLIISDQLCLSGLTFCTVSVIGISVKSHIGTLLSLETGLYTEYFYCVQ